MEEISFDWIAANEKEKHYRDQENLKGLFQVNFDFWRFRGFGDNYIHRFPRILYYGGRLRLHDELNKFLKENDFVIRSWITRELRDVSFKLNKIGQIFPDLSDEEFLILDELYSNSDYYDLLEEILFDQRHLKRLPKKLDVSQRGKTNSNFSDELLIEIFNAHLYNHFLTDKEGSEVFYYDRSKNCTVKKVLDENIKRGVHFLINFSIDISEIEEHVKSIFGLEFYKFYALEPRKGQSMELYRGISFGPSGWEGFLDRLGKYKGFKESSDNLKFKLMHKIAGDWLNLINSLKF